MTERRNPRYARSNSLRESIWQKARKTFFTRGADIHDEAWTTHFERVVESGMTIPNMQKIPKKKLSRALWRLVERLAELNVYLGFTNHLTDKQLYRQLTEETLHDLLRKDAITDDAAFFLGLINFTTPKGVEVFLRYYANRKEREEFKQLFPEVPLPPASVPPSRRDLFLPKPPGTELDS